MTNEVVFLDSMESFTVKKIQCWGSDELIALVAGISYGNLEVVAIETLLRKLIAREHLSPFEHAGFTFYLEIPIFVARQLLRYRHISANEMSRRYTTNKKSEFEFYFPNELKTFNDSYYEDRYSSAQLTILSAVTEYKDALMRGVKPELARTLLPVSLMTKLYLSTNIRELMHILKQRLAPAAQKEIQYVAQKMESVFRNEFPLTYRHYKGENSSD